MTNREELLISAIQESRKASIVNTSMVSIPRCSWGKVLFALELYYAELNGKEEVEDGQSNPNSKPKSL